MHVKWKDNKSVAYDPEQQIALACNQLLVVQPEKSDHADSIVRRKFEEVSSRENPRLFAIPLPKVNLSDKNTFLQQAIQRLNDFVLVDTHLGTEVRAIRRDAAGLLSDQVTFDASYEKMMEKVFRSSVWTLALIEDMKGEANASAHTVALGDDEAEMNGNVTNEKCLFEHLSRIERHLLARLTKASQIGHILRSACKRIISIKSPAERSQALLSFLCTSETIPCPKLVILVPQQHDTSNTLNFASIFQRRPRVKKPFDCTWRCFFVCQDSFQVANQRAPMEIRLDRLLLKQLAPLLKASLVAIALACGSMSNLPLELPFPEIGLKENMAEFDLMYKDVSKDNDYDVVANLDYWILAAKAQTLTDPVLLKMRRLVGKSFRAFSLIAMDQENRWCWEPTIEPHPVDGRAVWVLKGSK